MAMHVLLCEFAIFLTFLQLFLASPSLDKLLPNFWCDLAEYMEGCQVRTHIVPHQNSPPLAAAGALVDNVHFLTFASSVAETSYFLINQDQHNSFKFFGT